MRGLRRRRTHRLTAVGRWLLAIGGLMLACSAALAFAAPSSPSDAFDRTVRYLQERQNLDGGFALKVGRESDAYVSGWVAYALAAASINPQDQKRDGGRDVVSWIADNMRGFDETTDWERTLLVAVASGIDGRSFAGVDLIAPILARQREDGAVLQYAGGTPFVNATAFAIIAFSELDDNDPVLAKSVSDAADWLQSRGVQNEDGSWDWRPGLPGSADMTAAVIEALRAAGRVDTKAEQRAFGYLRTRVQASDGGFLDMPGSSESNSMSTAWVLQAMWAAGKDPRDWTVNGRDPLTYLTEMQLDDGGIKHKPSDTKADPWATAQSAPALAGRTKAIRGPPRRVVSPPDSQAPPPSAPPQSTPGTGGGNGGMSGGRDGQVIAGGGGRGARLFSSPKPQSKGRTRGGVRRTTAVAEERRRRARQAQVRDVPDEQPAAPPRADPRREQEREQKPPAARPLDPDAPAPEVRGTATGDDAAGTAATTGAADRAGSGGSSGGGGGGDPEVTGKLIGGLPQDAGAAGDDRLAAPGLRGARAGGEQGPALALGIGGALFVCTGLGSLLERRRPEDEQAVAT